MMAIPTTKTTDQDRNHGITFCSSIVPSLVILFGLSLTFSEKIALPGVSWNKQIFMKTFNPKQHHAEEHNRTNQATSGKFEWEGEKDKFILSEPSTSSRASSFDAATDSPDRFLSPIENPGPYGCWVQSPENLDTTKQKQPAKSSSAVNQTETKSSESPYLQDLFQPRQDTKNSRQKQQCRKQVRLKFRRRPSFPKAVAAANVQFRFDSIAVFGDDWSDIGTNAMTPLCSSDPDQTGVYCNPRNSNGPLIPEYLAAYFNVGPLSMSLLPAGNNYAMTGATTSELANSKTNTKDTTTGAGDISENEDKVNLYVYPTDDLTLVQSQINKYAQDTMASSTLSFKTQPATRLVPQPARQQEPEKQANSSKVGIVIGGGGGGGVKPMNLSPPTLQRLHVVTVGTNILLDVIRSYMIRRQRQQDNKPQSSLPSHPNTIIKQGVKGFEQMLQSLFDVPNLCNVLVLSPFDLLRSPLVSKYLKFTIPNENKMKQVIRKSANQLVQSFQKEINQVRRSFHRKCVRERHDADAAEWGIVWTDSTKLTQRVIHRYYKAGKSSKSNIYNTTNEETVPDNPVRRRRLAQQQLELDQIPATNTSLLHPRTVSSNNMISTISSSLSPPAARKTKRRTTAISLQTCNTRYIVPKSQCKSSATTILFPKFPWIPIVPNPRQQQDQQTKVWCQLPVVPTETCDCGETKNENNRQRRTIWFDEYHFTYQFNEYFAQELYLDLIQKKLCSS